MSGKSSSNERTTAMDGPSEERKSMPAGNPYAAPAPLEGFKIDGAAQLRPVAIVLLATSAPWTALLALSALAQLPRLIDSFQHEPFASTVGTTFGTLLPVLWSSAVVYGATLMLRMRHYSSARLSAVLALAPLCGPCAVLGIPLGIWALVVLVRPEVKAAFVD